ncbi:uncharacterized protein G2W53_039371 [Senna tora]|uniref:Uncharacterized protein n=1 Tax=Senna tora TaxID=362788 RepID=A0A834SQL8_9FABA|nr:uncharacterized protein G2W53_039371 [Senna tora]
MAPCDGRPPREEGRCARCNIPLPKIHK